MLTVNRINEEANPKGEKRLPDSSQGRTISPDKRLAKLTWASPFRRVDDCPNSARSNVVRLKHVDRLQPQPNQDQRKEVQMNARNNTKTDESAIRDLVENWARAVRTKNLDGILANHSPDILMFDVPPPVQSKGIEAYKKTWDLFFSWSRDFGVFDISEMTVTAGSDVAFVTALMRCAGAEANGNKIELEFRLTIGLRKIGGQWIVIHEHHSIPAPPPPDSAGESG
jgi:uncharacterized protein (TIGR02246 family)